MRIGAGSDGSRLSLLLMLVPPAFHWLGQGMARVLFRVPAVIGLWVLCTSGAASRAATPLDPLLAKRSHGEASSWFDVRHLGVDGQGWNESTPARFDRLPPRAQAVVPESVWGLSRHSAGLAVRFGSDATDLRARWTLTSAGLGMPHMPPTGVSGLDLYVREDSGAWRWLAVGQPREQTNAVTLIGNLAPGWREYLLYLPLYNGTRSLELGIPEQAIIAPGQPWGAGTRKPIVFYGTSITQGACASRPGMTHVALLGRRFQFPTINLGFSGSGRMEPALAELMAELDPSVYVLDCLPNLKPHEVTERVGPFVRRLREARPTTPILLVEDRFYPDGHLLASRRRHNEANHAALRAAYDALRSTGVRHLHYLPAGRLLGDDGEATVDGSHPTDLGFVRQSEEFARVLRPLLRRAMR